jgi:hypothetical protein
VVEKKKKEELGNQTWIGCTVSKHASHWAMANNKRMRTKPDLLSNKEERVQKKCALLQTNGEVSTPNILDRKSRGQSTAIPQNWSQIIQLQ